MNEEWRSQLKSNRPRAYQSRKSYEDRVLGLVNPNPKAKILDQIREVMRIKHYSLSTERSYCDWIKRYIRFHRMQSREELEPGEPKVESVFKSFGRNW